jgi:alkylation response protein AidB-like acyl-CoA dehydrogenase
MERDREQDASESLERMRSELAEAMTLAVAKREPFGPVEGARRYVESLASGGWNVPEWPRKFGGRGSSKADAVEIRRLIGEFRGPDLYPFIVGFYMVGPTLMQHGTRQQQERFLPRIADGTEIWCQMFSEPEAGSDLANVATHASRRGNTWALTGQKIWTSRAAYAEWGLCLARTDPNVPKHRGLTMFTVPMRATGVEVRPLVQMNGDDHFSEVFLDDVVIGEEQRIGAAGDGWTVALSVLSLERSASSQIVRNDSSDGVDGSPDLPPWLRQLRSVGYLEDPVRRHVAVGIYIASEVSRVGTLRAASNAHLGRAIGPEGSLQKLRNSGLYKARAYTLKEAYGATGMLNDHPGHDEAVTAPSMSIRGGTDEIQRNIIAERVLGLPPEPRLDRNLSWAETRHAHERDKGDTTSPTLI